VSRVQLFLSVAEGHNRYHGGQHTLWAKTVETPLPPAAGERVFAWPDGPMVEVAERYWNADGSVHCELKTCVVDPDDHEAKQLMSGLWQRQNWSWWTNYEDGRPEPGLERGGWRRWEP
jgi:hypothetical protein